MPPIGEPEPLALDPMLLALLRRQLGLGRLNLPVAPGGAAPDIPLPPDYGSTAPFAATTAQPLPPDYGSRAPFAPTPVPPWQRFSRAIGQIPVPSNPGVGWQMRNVLGLDPRVTPDYTNPKTPWNRNPGARPAPARRVSPYGERQPTYVGVGKTPNPYYRVGGRY